MSSFCGVETSSLQAGIQNVAPPSACHVHRSRFNRIKFLVVRTAYKCRAYPDQEQASVPNRTFGCIRVVWNQALAWRRQRYQADKTGTTYAQASAYLTAMKATEELTWLNEVSSLRATATGTVVRVFRDHRPGGGRAGSAWRNCWRRPLTGR